MVDRKLVLNVISESTAVVKADIRDESRLAEDLGMDSLDIVEVSMKIEEEFGVTIGDHDAEGVRTVGDVIALVNRLLEGKP